MIAKGKREQSKEMINNSFRVRYYPYILLNYAILLIIYLFHEKLLSWIGASGIVREMAKNYLLIAIITNIFSSFGYHKMGIFINLTSIMIDRALNIFFIFKLNNGLVGIALATLASISVFIVNNTILIYSNISYVGVWSIAQRIYLVLILPLVGLTQGIQSVIAYYDGSNLYIYFTNANF